MFQAVFVEKGKKKILVYVETQTMTFWGEGFLKEQGAFYSCGWESWSSIWKIYNLGDVERDWLNVWREMDFFGERVQERAVFVPSRILTYAQADTGSFLFWGMVKPYSNCPGNSCLTPFYLQDRE
ncbi:hypothetical protein XELAEV_18046747mg [Xenopus laevis]|uniref:Uncharacterized protein n=1 Tax=Xenopus laevis TaxID=8355 RepID=A0A974BU77_XENLA|nr:hypothetical protein XELAEV_18046747mg [Xenopus laevis]